ncbi:hypothetical protein [Microbulbifer sp. ANSA005]|uniref:hypothetical protein n=1 Tax=Microbulbifer sp. ANSA005 TaxID=3243362 RepID=UPI004042FD96
MTKKVCVVLGNGFTIDLMNHLDKQNKNIWSSIDVLNLFRFGDALRWPRDDRPGFLSYKNCPNLWSIGARSYLEGEGTLEIIERVVTSANVYSLKGKDLIDERAGNGFLLAYKELVYYLKYLFIHYNSAIPELDDVVEEWSWSKLFRKMNDDPSVEEVIIITYNYDIWLERVLNTLGIEYEIPLLDPKDASKFKIFKPHGSISFQHKQELPKESFEVNYKTFVSDCALSDIKVTYDNLEKHTPLNFLIPPAGESGRTDLNWTNAIKRECLAKIKSLSSDDTSFICGISYWHVDRPEIDELLVNMDDDAEVININPSPCSAFESVLNSLFKKYIHLDSSRVLEEFIK